MSLFGLPCASSSITSLCRCVRPSTSIETPSIVDIAGRRDVARDVLAAGEHRAHRVEQRVADRAVLAMKPRAPAASAAPIVARSCVADSTTIGRRGKSRSQLREQVEAVRAGQREVEQHQRAVRVAREHRQRLVAVGRAQHLEIGVEVGQHLRQRVQDQRMVVDHEYLHGSPGRGANCGTRVRLCDACGVGVLSEMTVHPVVRHKS